MIIECDHISDLAFSIIHHIIHNVVKSFHIHRESCKSKAQYRIGTQGGVLAYGPGPGHRK